MNRSTSFAAVLTTLLACAPVADAARKPPTQRCATLRGKSLLFTAKVKVVSRPGPQQYETVLLGCSRPNGVVRRLGTTSVAAHGTETDVIGAVGTWVRIDKSFGTSTSYGGTVSLVNVATGRGYTLLSYSEMTGNPFRPQATVDSLLLDTRGRSATAISTPTGVDEHGSPTGYDEAIAVHAPDGTTITLDHGSPSAIPPSSLAYQQGVVSWTHDGEPRAVLFS